MEKSAGEARISLFFIPTVSYSGLKGSWSLSQLPLGERTQVYPVQGLGQHRDKQPCVLG